MSEQAKNCPFCGNAAETAEEYETRSGLTRWMVCCNSCEARTTSVTAERALAAWNRRASPAGEGAGAEPVAWMRPSIHEHGMPVTTPIKADADEWERDGFNVTPLYTSPPLLPATPEETVGGKVAAPTSIYDALPPSAMDWLTSSDPPMAVSGEWVEGWDACRNRVRMQVDSAVASGVKTLDGGQQ